jgi:hypothetical protein
VERHVVRSRLIRNTPEMGDEVLEQCAVILWQLRQLRRKHAPDTLWRSAASRYFEHW